MLVNDLPDIQTMRTAAVPNRDAKARGAPYQRSLHGWQVHPAPAPRC